MEEWELRLKRGKGGCIMYECMRWMDVLYRALKDTIEKGIYGCLAFGGWEG